MNGRFQASHFAEVQGDGFGLAALLGVDAGVSAHGVDKRDDRPAEFGGQLHQPECLAIAFGLRHAEVAIQLLFGIAALLLANHHDGLPFKEGKAADNGLVVTEGAVAVQFLKAGEQTLNVVEGVGPLGMPGQDDALVGGAVDFLDNGYRALAHRAADGSGAG